MPGKAWSVLHARLMGVGLYSWCTLLHSQYNSEVIYDCVSIKSRNYCFFIFQVYKGPKTSCQIPITSFSSPYEARVRCCTTCVVNDLEEQQWSTFSPSVQCTCSKKKTEDIPDRGGATTVEGQSSAEGDGKMVQKKEPFSAQTLAIIVFIVLSIITLILAFILGQYVKL